MSDKSSIEMSNQQSRLRLELLPKNSKARLTVYGLFLLAVVFVLITQIDILIDSITVLRTVSWVYVAAVLVTAVATYFVAALIYSALSFYPLRYRRTVLVQMAGMFVNRLLPSGIGSISVSYLYLRQSGHQVAQAASVVTVNNALGLLAHVSVAAMLVLFNRNAFSAVAAPRLPQKTAWLLLFVLAVTVVALYVAQHFRHKIVLALRQFIVQLVSFRTRKARLAIAFGASTCLVLLNVLSLMFAVRAVHGNVNFAVALAVFTSGLIVGTLTPTPGGLGGAEAGLVAALIAYGIPLRTAIAAAVLYRIISYWFALILGGTAFVVVDRRKYL